MKVAILGGTGAMGSALAMQLSKKHSVEIGSRDPAKAKTAAARIEGALGDTNEAAARWCDAALAAVPFSAVGSLRGLADGLTGKLVVSLVNPLKMEGSVLQYASVEKSAAETIAQALPGSSVSTAFNNVPASLIRRPPQIGLHILVAADSREAYVRTAELVRSVPGMLPLYAGPLSQAESIERLTVLVLNAARLNGGSGYAPYFVSK